MIKTYDYRDLVNQLKKIHNRAEKSDKIFETQGIGRRETYCFVKYGKYLFALRADTKHSAIQTLIEQEKAHGKKLFSVTETKNGNLCLRIGDNQEANGWYCYLHKENCSAA